jgi:thioredoxin 1
MIKEYDINDVSDSCIIDFWAPWCGPCRMTGKYLEEFSEKHPEINIYKVNVDELPEVAEHYGVISLPTILCVSKDEILWRHIGLMTVKQLEDTL